MFSFISIFVVVLLLVFDNGSDATSSIVLSDDGSTSTSSTTTAFIDNVISNTITCQPKHLHLALGPTSVAVESKSSSSTSSMTVSFTVPFECGPPGKLHEVFIKYGKVDENGGEHKHKHNNNGNVEKHNTTTSSPTWQTVSPPSEIPTPRQHNATHPGHSLYVSDYFYHVPLPNLSSQTRYRYEIQVRSLSKSQPLSLNLPLEATPANLSSNSVTSKKRYLQGSHSYPIQEENDVLRIKDKENYASSFSSGVNFFKTPPLPGDQDKPMTLAIVADLGQTIHSAHTLGHMARYASTSSISAILHAGDISYADCDLKRWDSWFDMVANTTVDDLWQDGIKKMQQSTADTNDASSSSSLLPSLGSSIPWHICPGNHELEIEHFSGNVYASYRARFDMPKGPFSSNEYIKPLDPFDPLDINIMNCGPSVAMTEYDYGNSFHSIEIGYVKAIFLNTYTSSKPGSNQYQWLVKELNSIDRTKTPWVVILMHGPFYNTFHEHSHEKMTEEMKINFEPLFIKHDINLVICGHVHAYSRTKPVKQNVVASDQKAPTYIILGDGGNREGHATYKSPTKPEEWIDVRDNTTFGFALLDVHNSTHAKWSWMKNIDEGRIDTHDHVHLVNYHFL